MDDNSNKYVTILLVNSNDNESDSDNDRVCTPAPENKQTIKSRKPKKRKFVINSEKDITDLKSLIDALTCDKVTINQRKLVEDLNNLNNVIGMNLLKQQITDQIILFLQNLQDPETYLHTVILGPPGTGKTKLINILAKIYSKLGILRTDKVIVADRSKLIGKWLGSTAIKTKELLESASGGILVIDEVYSLGNKETSDSFSKECIDTLNQYLSEHVSDFICIIAGYKDLVNECFFNYNPGLERRFPWKFTIESYTPEELVKIMKLQITEIGWKTSATDSFLISLVSSNKECFKGNGGDTKNLIDRCKMHNAKRTFVKNYGKLKKTDFKMMTKDDITNGMKDFTMSKQLDQKDLFMTNMYS